MVGAREVAPHVVCIGVGIVRLVFSIDIIEDKQPVGIILPSKPTYHLSDNYIDVAVTIYGVCLSRLRNLAFWDPARGPRNAPLEATLAPSI